MQQVKLFKTVETEIIGLEKDINRWIRESRVRIVSVTGNISPQSGSPSAETTRGYVPSDVLVVVLYDDGL